MIFQTSAKYSPSNVSHPKRLHSSAASQSTSNLTGLKQFYNENTPDRGCPQGEVLSPLLWCLVVNDLSEELRRQGFHVYGYADYIAIVVGGCFLSTLRDLMEYALKIINRWCKTKGLVVNPQKTNIMIFTKKYKPETIETLRFEGQEISFTDTVKYLGVLLDPKLN
jgi:retron-type reverse transcriptase